MTQSTMLRGAMLGLVTSVFGFAAAADGKNWDATKIDQIEVNRNSDAGRGNGGERRMKLGPNAGTWQATWYGEDGPADRDPGGSEGRNMACGDSETGFKLTGC